MLFETFNRTNFEHKKRCQTSYEFLNNSSWKISEFSRNILEKFCKNYLVDEEFIKMFKSKSNKQHDSAIFEIMVYTCLKNSNFIIKKHPITKTGKRPDFEINLDDYSKIYLECTLSGHSIENEDEKNRKETVEEIIENIDFFPYFINLDFIKISKKSISKKRLINFIKQTKDICDIYSDEQLINIYFNYTDNDWIINLSFFRKKNLIKRSLGFISDEPKIIEKSKAILTALNDKKATKYGIENEPYIICVSINDISITENDISEILFGQYNISLIDLSKSTNGFWTSNIKPFNSTVSAIIFFKNFNLFALENSEISIWHNPFAKNKLKHGILPFDEYLFENTNNFITMSKVKKDKDVFDLLKINKSDYISMNKKESI